MLSLFPELLFLSPFAAFLIRIGLSVVFGVSAWRRVHGTPLVKAFGVIDTLLATAFLVGFSTQLAAIIGAICTAAWLIKADWNPYPKSTAALALVMCLSLLVLGPGPFAFDLPL